MVAKKETVNKITQEGYDALVAEGAALQVGTDGDGILRAAEIKDVSHPEYTPGGDVVQHGAIAYGTDLELCSFF